jgi:hypothetical protein
VHALPEGTVTFLFTDVEGSTRLLREVGAERYAEVLAEHPRTPPPPGLASRGRTRLARRRSDVSQFIAFLAGTLTL